MRCLLVIDMQEYLIGVDRNKKKHPYDAENLIECINERIISYSAESVIYITNKFFWELGKEPKKLVLGMKVVSDNIFEKRKNSCLSNHDLLTYLKKMGANELELVGVDGNYCVAASAIDGVKKGFSVFCNESCIGAGNVEKFKKVKTILAKESVEFI